MQEIFKSPSLLSCMFIACLWRIKHDNATAFTLFVYISKWNALHSNKIAMQIAKYLREWKREQDFFQHPIQLIQENIYDSIHIRHPDYEWILRSIHRKSWKIVSKTE